MALAVGFGILGLGASGPGRAEPSQGTAPEQSVPRSWSREWPRTDFASATVSFTEILSGGPPKDGIPAVDRPLFSRAADVDDIGETEPVIGLVINDDARAYPLSIMTWHEIVNDEVGGRPVTITYCPLCNTSIVFDRRVEGRVLDFGTTGKLRNSDLVMYDRQTESWWQQFTGEAIVGSYVGSILKMVPSRLESFADFKARAPGGLVLRPDRDHPRPYGRNPYPGYDQSEWPMLFSGNAPESIAPMARVVAVGDRAWSLDLLRRKGRIEDGELILSWHPGQNSALDARTIADGRDVGSVIVQRRTANGARDEAYEVTFAFAFHAFHPAGSIKTVSVAFD